MTSGSCLYRTAVQLRPLALFKLALKLTTNLTSYLTCLSRPFHHSATLAKPAMPLEGRAEMTLNNVERCPDRTEQHH